MNEDRLLRDLGQLAREQGEAEAARLDERWDRLSRGELTPEEDDELRAETSPEAREAYEAFRPLGPEFQAGVVQKLQKERGRVLPFPRIAGWGALVAAAAAVLIVLLRSPAPLPDYGPLQVTGVSVQRGEAAPEIPSAAPGGQFKVLFQPRTAAPAKQRLEAGCFLSQGREVRRMVARSVLDPGGSILMACAVAADVLPGTWTLWAVAGRPGDLPGPEDLRLLSGGQVRRRDWVALSKEVRIQSRGE